MGKELRAEGRYKTSDGKLLAHLPPRKRPDPIPQPKPGYFCPVFGKPVVVSVPLPSDPPPPYFSAGFYANATECSQCLIMDLEAGLQRLADNVQGRNKSKYGSKDYDCFDNLIKTMVNDFGLPYHIFAEHKRYNLDDVDRQVRAAAARNPIPEWNQLLDKVWKKKEEAKSRAALRAWEEKMDNLQIIWPGHQHPDGRMRLYPFPHSTDYPHFPWHNS
ncbi:MAG: hypothetical protein Q9220_001847 [cf. Caloplaca sp. 1 TL-2023]